MLQGSSNFPNVQNPQGIDSVPNAPFDSAFIYGHNHGDSRTVICVDAHLFLHRHANIRWCVAHHHKPIVRHVASGVKHGVAIDQYRNFNDFPNSLHTLTTVCFGEWVVLLKDLEVAAHAFSLSCCLCLFRAVYLSLPVCFSLNAHSHAHSLILSPAACKVVIWVGASGAISKMHRRI